MSARMHMHDDCISSYLPDPLTLVMSGTMTQKGHSSKCSYFSLTVLSVQHQLDFSRKYSAMPQLLHERAIFIHVQSNLDMLLDQ